MNIQQAKGQAIQRKDHVPDYNRTEGKDEAAEWVEENVIEEDLWPMDLEDIAEETGWSRQHIANTIRDYFEPVRNGAEIQMGEGKAHIEFDVPQDVHEDSYVRGYLRGWLDAKDT